MTTVKKRIIAPALASALATGLATAFAPPDAAAQQQEQQLFYPPPGVTGPSWGAPGYWWRGPDRFEQAEPRSLSELFEEQFRRGYERGRLEGRMARQGEQQPQQQGVPSVNWLVNPEYAGSAQISPRLPDEATMLRVRQALQQARRALQQGNPQRADQALAQIDRMLGGGERQRLQQALEDAEQALRRNDRRAAEEALRRARQAVGGQQQAQLTTQPGQGQQASPAAAQQQPQQATGAAQVAVEQSEQYGAYLTDAGGRALYLFTADKQGSGATQAQSNCYDACAEAWPPLLTQGEPQAGQRADAALLGTIQRRGGATQVTYNGWPLYYFVQDQGPGEATGQDKHGFGGEWYLLAPEGKKVEEEG